jgi:hypothetical protein
MQTSQVNLIEVRSSTHTAIGIAVVDAQVGMRPISTASAPLRGWRLTGAEESPG